MVFNVSGKSSESAGLYVFVIPICFRFVQPSNAYASMTSTPFVQETLSRFSTFLKKLNGIVVMSVNVNFFKDFGT